MTGLYTCSVSLNDSIASRRSGTLGTDDPRSTVLAKSCGNGGNGGIGGCGNDFLFLFKPWPPVDSGLLRCTMGCMSTVLREMSGTTCTLVFFENGTHKETEEDSLDEILLRLAALPNNGCFDTSTACCCIGDFTATGLD